MVSVAATRPTVPPDPPFGPRPRPVDWAPVLRGAQQLAEDVAAAANGHAIPASLAGDLARRRDVIAAAWASAAAAELEAVHGLKRGTLGGLGVPTPNKLVPLATALAVKASRRPTPSAALAWGISILTELAALAARLTVETDRGPGTQGTRLRIGVLCNRVAGWEDHAFPLSYAWEGRQAFRR